MLHRISHWLSLNNTFINGTLNEEGHYVRQIVCSKCMKIQSETRDWLAEILMRGK